MDEAGPAAKYRILDEIGRGAMGRVCKAEDLSAGRLVALKFLADRYLRDPEAVARFEREGLAAAGLHHPNICTVFESGVWQGRPFIAMEFLDGWSLSERLAIRKLTVVEALEIGIQALDGLAAAHAAGIVHRDIKPGNLFITRRAQVKLLDFGLAKLRSSHRSAPPSDSNATVAFFATMPGTLVGTFAYMAPEQVRGETLDGRADLYALGVVLYEALTGTLPAPGASAPDLPPHLMAFLGRMLARDVNGRYPGAVDAREALAALRQGSRGGV